MIKDNDYVREVMAQLMFLETEDDTLLRDIEAAGLEGNMRRAAIDGVIAQMWEPNTMDFCKAMRMADVTALQAARVISAFGILNGRRNSENS
jgi:hypothetical protein